MSQLDRIGDASSFAPHIAETVGRVVWAARMLV